MNAYASLPWKCIKYNLELQTFVQSPHFQFLHCFLSDWLEIGHVFVCEFRPPRHLSWTVELLASEIWDLTLSILLLTKASRAFLDHGDVYSSSILLLQGLIQQTLKMCQLVFPLPTFPPSLPPAICFELLAQELFSLWFQKFASHSKKPCYFVLFGTWQESERNTKKKKRIFFSFFFLMI